MNLRPIANMVSRTVNPNITVDVLRSDGFTIGVGKKQVPKYSPAVTGRAQLQALDADDIKQLDGLNIQGTIRAIYLYGHLAGVVRPDQTGGDIVKTVDIRGFPGTRTWLVVRVLEGWADWTKAAIVLQGD